MKMNSYLLPCTQGTIEPAGTHELSVPSAADHYGPQRVSAEESVVRNDLRKAPEDTGLGECAACSLGGFGEDETFNGGPFDFIIYPVMAVAALSAIYWFSKKK
jgi:hypothetical protein